MTLEGKIIAVPESRQLDVMATLLESSGGSVVRAPLVAFQEVPDPAPVLDWMRRFIEEPHQDFVILTGEGIRHLLKIAQANGMMDLFMLALSSVRKVCCGPKPDKALATVNLRGECQSPTANTESMIATLDDLDLDGHRVAVQLTGPGENGEIVDYLKRRGARVSQVAPYLPAGESEEAGVVSLIRDMAQQKYHAIAFTSQPQVKRLLQVARKHSLEDILKTGMSSIAVAAVGPVVKDQLESSGFQVDIMPDRTYFMKPLVKSIVQYLNAH